MQSEDGMEARCHFAGVNTWLLLRYLREHGGPDAAERCCAAAGDTRTADELLDLATWSSYDQFRRLLEVDGGVVRRRDDADAPRPAAASPTRRCPR